MCKRTPVTFFSTEELEQVADTWGKRKSAGPDGVSYEGLRAIMNHSEGWKHRLLEVFSDALYKAHMPNMDESLTVLLAKVLMPHPWAQTRQITLCSAILKTFSQLLLGRGRHLLMNQTGIQWAERRKQVQELIYVLKRLARVSSDWGLTLFVLELDLEKAFDTVVQGQMGEMVLQKIAIEGGAPWEARAWLQLIQSSSMQISTDSNVLHIPQSNGLRQGSPDSPVLFAGLVAQVARYWGSRKGSHCPYPHQVASTWTTHTSGL